MAVTTEHMGGMADEDDPKIRIVPLPAALSEEHAKAQEEKLREDGYLGYESLPPGHPALGGKLNG